MLVISAEGIYEIDGDTRICVGRTALAAAAGAHDRAGDRTNDSGSRTAR